MAGQGTGHGAVPLGSLEDAILVKTVRMRDVTIEGEKARVEAGALAEDVADAAIKDGRCSMPGTSPNVGVTGFTLGGGLSWLGRKYGWACNRVSAIELVTADGEARTVDAGSDPDLFWALRGGGGGYAIVTALHLELLPVAEAYAGGLLFPSEIGADGVRRYRDWAANAPEEAATMVRFLNLPPIPDVPEPLRGQSLLAIAGAYLGTQEEGEKAFAPLREIGEPVMDTFTQMPAPGLTRIAMDPEPPVPGLGHHRVIHELSDEAIDAFVEAAGPDSGSPLLLAELRQLGGALARPAENGGALDKLDGEFVDARHRDADGPGYAGADRGPAGQALSRDGALGRRRRLLQLRRASLRRRGDPAGRDVQPALAGEAQLGSRRAASWRTTRSRWRRPSAKRPRRQASGAAGPGRRRSGPTPSPRSAPARSSRASRAARRPGRPGPRDWGSAPPSAG